MECGIHEQYMAFLYVKSLSVLPSCPHLPPHVVEIEEGHDAGADNRTQDGLRNKFQKRCGYDEDHLGNEGDKERKHRKNKACV